MNARFATIADFDQLEPLFRKNAARMSLDYQSNFEPISKQILSDTKYGFVVMAEHHSVAVGFIMFTYEWSDWRDGIFCWV
jgi:hypothetical protein